ncbi:MAG: AAA family ATPase [Chloroflexi bacterium]|nr:AAA family ATPase [Chloroflexota bacterium]
MKKRSSPAYVVLIALAAMLFSFAPGGSISAQSRPYAWRTYNRYDGVHASWINTTVQTWDHALWFGTDQGVLRYDGEWKAFEEEEGLPAGPVRTLLLDKGGTLWAATVEGVARLEGETWLSESQQNGLPVAPFLTLVELPDGALWAGGGAGLYARNPATGVWSAIESPVEEVFALMVDDSDSVWLASGSELFRRQNDRWEKLSLRLNGNTLSSPISALIPSLAGGVWIATDGQGLLYYDEGVSDWFYGPTVLPSDRVMAVLEDGDGELWVGTNGGGLAHFYADTIEILRTQDGLAADFVSSIYEDRDGVLWFGTVAGISRYDPKGWMDWSKDENAPQQRVQAMALDANGVLWVGAFGEGLHRFSDGVWQKFDLQKRGVSAPINYIESLFVDDQGRLWIGSNGMGVIRYAKGKAVQLTRQDGLASNTVLAIAQTPDGALWFGSFRDGLSRLQNNEWTTFTKEDGLISNEIQTLFVDTQGRLWVGTPEGVSVFDGSNWRSFTVDDGLAGPDIRGIAETSDGSLWFATWGDGASRLRKGEWTSYNTADGLLAPGVGAVWASPDEDKVWFGTVGGLSVFDGLTWQNFGVTSRVNAAPTHVLLRDREGRVYLGTDRGVVRYFPHETPPLVEIVDVNGSPPRGGRVQISPEEHVRISLASRDILTDPTRLLYRYRLIGYDEAWQVSRNSVASYPPLPLGLYRFEVMSRDEDMNYSSVAQVDIEVRLPPSLIWVPGLGFVPAGYALTGVAVATVFALLLGYAVWSTATRLAMQRLAVERRFNPYIAGSPIRDKEMFYGRDDLLDQLETALYNNSIMIHGERRIGKTSVLYQLKQRLETKEDPEYRFIPVFVDLEGAPESLFFHRLMEGVVETLQDALKHMPDRDKLHFFANKADEAYDDRDFRRDLRAILRFLQGHYRRQPKLIFLLDEADIMNTYDTLTQQQLRRILQDTLAQHVGAVVAGVNISKAWDRVESPWYNMFVEVALEPFDRREAERLMKEPVEQFYKWEDDAVHFVYAQSQGRPHRVQQICMEAVNHMLDEGRRTITLADVQYGYDRIIFAENT